jgi:two-component system, NarL family, sensor histidine kinase DesK
VSTVGRQQPGSGIRARLLNRGAYRWYFGTIFGLVYQIAEFVYVWTNGGTLATEIIATGLLVFFYLCYVVLPPLIWPQSARFRTISIVIYWLATFALIPFVGVFTVWVWTLVAAMVPFCWLRLRTTIALGAMVIAAQGVVALIQKDSLGNGTAIAPFVTVSVLISLIAITNQIEANRKLRDAQATIASLAAADERARLARDLHDVLGHSLTVVAVKSELAGRLVERDPKKAIAEIADIEGLARTALADLRAAVSSYRDMNLDSELNAARTALDAAGIRAHLPEDASGVDADLRPLFGWVLREGVTNVIRHAQATECWVDLQQKSLSVRDDGHGIPGDGAGNGLKGLTERASEAGARLTAVGGESGGFVLTVAKATK